MKLDLPATWNIEILLVLESNYDSILAQEIYILYERLILGSRNNVNMGHCSSYCH